MADEEDDDVIHLASFNVHRSQGRRARRRRQAYITISDDSDEEPVTPVGRPRWPVLVPDEPDDDISILESPPRRRMIRPAASWGGASGRDDPIIEVAEEVVEQTATGSGGPAVELRENSPARPLLRPQTLFHSGPSTSTDPQPTRPTTSTQPQPTLPSTSTHPQPTRPSTSTQPQPGPSTSTHPHPEPSTSTHPQLGPTSSTQPHPEPSTSTHPHPEPSTSTHPQPGPSSSTHPHPEPSSSTQPQPGPSSSTHPEPSTSTQPQPGSSTTTVPQPALATTRPLIRPQTLFHSRYAVADLVPLFDAHTNKVTAARATAVTATVTTATLSPLRQVLQQATVPRPPQPLNTLLQPSRPRDLPLPRVAFPHHAAAPPAVLVAAAPERLGPPETGHRITLGSQAAANTNPHSNARPPPPRAAPELQALPLEPPGAMVNLPALDLNGVLIPNPNPAFRDWLGANPLLFPNPEGADPPPAVAGVLEPPPLAPALGPALDPARNPPAPALAAVPDPFAPAPALAAVPDPFAPAAAPVAVAAAAPALPPLPWLAEERPGPSAAARPQRPPDVTALIKGVLDLLPHVREAYVAELIMRNNIKDLNVICDMLLGDPDYAQREIAASAQTSILLETNDTHSTPVSEDLFDYAKLGPVKPETLLQASDLLNGDFRMLACHDIKWALNALKGHYAITRKALCDALGKMKSDVDPSGKKHSYINFTFEHGTVKLTRKMYFLTKCRVRRSGKAFTRVLEPALKNELAFYEQKAKEQAEHEDFRLALQLNEEQYEKDGQLIQCGCCFGEFAFEEMTQCTDGHLFCKECLVNYAQEAAFGAGRSQLSCLAPDCTCSFPVSELEKVLPEHILVKYYERQAEEAVSGACAEELVRCPFCSFPALLDKEVSLFSCPNPRCRKESCRKCHVQWKQHVGKSCEEVLERDEIKMRVLFEERMTAARVRKCWKCQAGLVKSEGCNRMSCRCGGFMCYLCREPISGYYHFCQHARSPGAPCRQCHKCSLWTDPTQDDERIIQEIQKKGEEELNKKSAENSGKRVGPPPEAPINAKQPRLIGPPPQNIEPPPHPQLLVRGPVMVPPPPGAPLRPVPPPRVMYPALLPDPYVPPMALAREPLDYNLVNFNGVELNLPMHYVPHHRRR